MRKLATFFALTFVALVAACGGNSEEITSTPTPTGTPTPGDSPTPSATAIPTPEPTPSPTPEPTPSPNPTPGPGRIVFWRMFSRYVGAERELYIMNPDGSGLTLLTGGVVADRGFPSVSSDGTQLAFTASHEGNDDIYILNIDDGQLINLSNNPARDWEPTWSPDGTQLAFASDRDGDWEIYVINVDGSGQTKLTDNLISDRNPDWSPHDAKIAFYRATPESSPADLDGDLFVINSDGTGIQQLTDSSDVQVLGAKWSPDGSRIVIQDLRDIYVTNGDGSGLTNLTDSPRQSIWFSWSPDSSRLAFQEGEGDIDTYNLDIYIINADGSGLMRLTSDPGHDVFAKWSPAGTEIAFASRPREKPGENDSPPAGDLWVTNVDGSSLTRLTDDHPGADLAIAWVPAP